MRELFSVTRFCTHCIAVHLHLTFCKINQFTFHILHQTEDIFPSSHSLNAQKLSDSDINHIHTSQDALSVLPNNQIGSSI